MALASLIEDSGGTILTATDVAEITVADGAATGVLTADGERFDAARAVVASTAPDQLYGRLLTGAGDAVAPEIRAQGARFRYGATCVQVHLALAEAPRFAADERLNACGQPSLTPGSDGLSGSAPLRKYLTPYSSGSVISVGP